MENYKYYFKKFCGDSLLINDSHVEALNREEINWFNLVSGMQNMGKVEDNKLALEDVNGESYYYNCEYKCVNGNKDSQKMLENSDSFFQKFQQHSRKVLRYFTEIFNFERCKVVQIL